MSGFVARIMTSDKDLLYLAQKAKVEEALRETEKMVTIYDESPRIILRKILEAMIEFRVAVLVGDAKQEKEYSRKMNHLCSLLPSVGLTEEEATKKMKTIAEILMERRKSNASKRRR